MDKKPIEYDHGCAVVEGSSRVCEDGTKGCLRIHPVVGSEPWLQTIAERNASKREEREAIKKWFRSPASRLTAIAALPTLTVASATQLCEAFADALQARDDFDDAKVVAQSMGYVQGKTCAVLLRAYEQALEGRTIILVTTHGEIVMQPFERRARNEEERDIVEAIAKHVETSIGSGDVHERHAADRRIRGLFGKSDGPSKKT